MQIFEFFALIWEHRYESVLVGLLAYSPFILMLAMLVNLWAEHRMMYSIRQRVAALQREEQRLTDATISECRHAVADYTREVRAWDYAAKCISRGPR